MTAGKPILRALVKRREIEMAMGINHGRPEMLSLSFQATATLACRTAGIKNRRSRRFLTLCRLAGQVVEELLHAVKETFRLRFVFLRGCSTQGFFKLTQQFFLLAAEVNRGFNHQFTDQITKPPPRTDCTPLPRMRNMRPVWVSGGTFRLTRPSSVGTSTSPPNAAMVKLTGTSQ